MPDPTIIRAQTLVQGNLTGEDPVEVEGQLIGAVALQNTLTVHPGGLVRGQLRVTQAIIFGRVEGSISAAERIYLGPSAVVVADLDAPLVRVDDGAKLHGKLLMELDAPAPAVAPLALPAVKPAAKQEAKPAAQPAKPAFGSFTSPSRPAAPVAQPPVAQPTKPLDAPSFATRPASTPATVTQPAAQPAAQPARTAVAVVEPDPAPAEVVAVVEAVEAPVAVEVVEAVEAPVVVEAAEAPVVEEIVEVEEAAIVEVAPAAQPDADDADEPDDGHDDGHDALAAEAAKYEHYTVKELREELRRLDLPVSGSKEDLIERLISAQ